MNCSYKGVFENTISSAGYDNNYGFDGPYSNAYSLNSRSGRLTAGILPELYKPDIEGPSTISGIHASYDRLFYNNGNYDGQYIAGLGAGSGGAGQAASQAPVAEANAQLAEVAQVAPEVAAELPPPSDAPEPTDLPPEERTVITQQPVADETTDTVAVNVEPNPPETIKEQESFIFGGRRRANRLVNSKQPVSYNGVYTAPSKRLNPQRETFTTEINGLRDSQYLHEAFLDTKQEQEQSNAIALVVLTVCFFIITIAVIWTTFGCKSNDFDSLPPVSPAPVKPVSYSVPETTAMGLTGGAKSSRLSGSIF